MATAVNSEGRAILSAERPNINHWTRIHVEEGAGRIFSTACRRIADHLACVVDTRGQAHVTPERTQIGDRVLTYWVQPGYCSPSDGRMPVIPSPPSKSK
jgi:hypothetical protein